MIEHEKEKYGWEFIFLAANIDAVDTARLYGIDADHAVDYIADVGGSAVMHATMNAAIRSVRDGCDLTSDRSWRKAADRDYKKRRK